MANNATKATSRAAVFFMPRSYPCRGFTNKNSARLICGPMSLAVVVHLALFANRVAGVALNRIFVFRNPGLTRDDSMVIPVVRGFILGYVVPPIVADVIRTIVRVHQEGSDDGSGSGGDKHRRRRVGLNRPRNKDGCCGYECEAGNETSEDILT